MTKTKKKMFKSPPEEDYKKRVGRYLLSLIIFGALLVAFIIYFSPHQSICKQHPDKCVCERYKTTEDGYYFYPDDSLGKEVYPNAICSEFRKKTQSELDIDDCNNNPDKCVCLSNTTLTNYVSIPVKTFNFNNELKELIRKRDNYKCQICGIPQEECFKNLHVHHIDFNKSNCSPDNLITFCNSCHSKQLKKERMVKKNG